MSRTSDWTHFRLASYPWYCSYTEQIAPLTLVPTSQLNRGTILNMMEYTYFIKKAMKLISQHLMHNAILTAKLLRILQLEPKFWAYLQGLWQRLDIEQPIKSLNIEISKYVWENNFGIGRLPSCLNHLVFYFHQNLPVLQYGHQWLLYSIVWIYVYSPLWSLPKSTISIKWAFLKDPEENCFPMAHLISKGDVHIQSPLLMTSRETFAVTTSWGKSKIYVYCIVRNENLVLLFAGVTFQWFPFYAHIRENLCYHQNSTVKSRL